MLYDLHSNPSSSHTAEHQTADCTHIHCLTGHAVCIEVINSHIGVLVVSLQRSLQEEPLARVVADLHLCCHPAVALAAGASPDLLSAAPHLGEQRQASGVTALTCHILTKHLFQKQNFCTNSILVSSCTL